MRTRGFTLIDLMITLAVAAILLTAGVPALSGFIAAQRITVTSNLLVTDLNFARTRAITDYDHLVMCPSLDGQTCTGGNRWEHGWIVYIDRNREWAPDDDDDLLRVSEPRESVEIRSTRLHSERWQGVRFSPDGQAQGYNLTVTVCDPARPERTRDVVVYRTGRVRSQDRPLIACDLFDS